MKVIVRRTSVVFGASNNHMTSACGGLVRLGVKGLGVRAAMGDGSKVSASIPSGVRSRNVPSLSPTMRDASPFMPGAGIAY